MRYLRHPSETGMNGIQPSNTAPNGDRQGEVFVVFRQFHSTVRVVVFPVIGTADMPTAESRR
jgi:hypothetical protein